MAKTAGKPSTVRQVLIEFVSVVFAVLLALGLNAYKESLSKKKKAESIKASIVKECESNLELVKATLESNSEYIAFLDSVIANDSKEITGLRFNYSFDLLNSSAWTSAQNMDAFSSLDHEFLRTASDIYQSQEFIKNTTHQVFMQVGMLVANSEKIPDRQLARSLYYYTGALHEMTKNLEELLTDFYKAIENENNNPQ